MKTVRFPVVLVVILVVAAYFAGTLFRASAAATNGLQLPSVSAAPALTAAEWAAISSANALLLNGDAPEPVYLPLIVH